MPATRETTAYARRLISEYNRARKRLHKYLKKPHEPSDVTAMIIEVIDNMTARQSKIIGYTLNMAFTAGTKEDNAIIKKARLTAATDASLGFDMRKVADTHLNKITGDTIGRIGKYNSVVTNQLFGQYQTLLADNTLVNTLGKSGWSQSIEKSLVKRGIAPEVISQLKGQTTTKKIVSILETQGIRGGMNPRQVSRLLQPHVSGYFGQKGVIIDNVGKFKKVLKVDADGNFKYIKQAITRPYKATSRAYSNLLARSSMLQAHHEGRYKSLQASKLVDHYISVSLLDANTCGLCASMHGQRVSHREGPLYHPNCHCRAKPIFKEDSGLTNKDPSYYDNQRDQHFWKQHQLAEYNKNMPRGAKLKFHSMLPKDAFTDMPGKEAMRAIRYDALGKPGAIKPTVVKPKSTKVTPKATKKVEKKQEKKIIKEKVERPQVVKKAQLEKMKKEEREKANELWKKTDKDGFEHEKVTNSETFFGDGDDHSVWCKKPNAPFKSQHTHPGWDSPFSASDLSNFLSNPNYTQQAASSSKRIYLATRKSDTIRMLPQDRVGFKEAFQKLAKEKSREGKKLFKTKTGWNPTKSQAQKIWHDALEETTKKYAKEYNFDYITFKRT